MSIAMPARRWLACTAVPPAAAASSRATSRSTPYAAGPVEGPQSPRTTAALTRPSTIQPRVCCGEMLRNKGAPRQGDPAAPHLAHDGGVGRQLRLVEQRLAGRAQPRPVLALYRSKGVRPTAAVVVVVVGAAETIACR